jgi:glycerate kinase
MVLDALRFDECIRGADLIITGEGKLDKQTCMGKTPCGVLQAGMRQDIPVIVMGGSVEEVEALNKSGFLAVLPLLPYPVSLEQAMDKDFTCRNIGRALEQQLRVIHYYMNH